MNPMELKIARIRRNKSATEMAKMVGITDSARITRERGKTRVSLEEAVAISRYLDLSEDEFYTIFFDGEIPFRKTG